MFDGSSWFSLLLMQLDNMQSDSKYSDRLVQFSEFVNCCKEFLLLLYFCSFYLDFFELGNLVLQSLQKVEGLSLRQQSVA